MGIKRVDKAEEKLPQRTVKILHLLEKSEHLFAKDFCLVSA